MPQHSASNLCFSHILLQCNTSPEGHTSKPHCCCCCCCRYATQAVVRPLWGDLGELGLPVEYPVAGCVGQSGGRVLRNGATGPAYGIQVRNNRMFHLLGLCFDQVIVVLRLHRRLLVA
jgi:hypothetical protein